MGEENSFIQSPFAEKNKKMIKHCVEKFQKKFEVYGGGGVSPSLQLAFPQFSATPSKNHPKNFIQKNFKKFLYFQIRHDFYFLIQILQIEF